MTGELKLLMMMMMMIMMVAMMMMMFGITLCRLVIMFLLGFQGNFISCDI